jgi:hypothetical protein
LHGSGSNLFIVIKVQIEDLREWRGVRIHVLVLPIASRIVLITFTFSAVRSLLV